MSEEHVYKFGPNAGARAYGQPAPAAPPPKPVMWLDSTKLVWRRWPRSKKRRIIRKWLRRRENWRPDRRVWQDVYIFGAAVTPEQCGLGQGREPKSFSMHPEAWHAAVAQKPEIAEQFDVRDRDAAMTEWQRANEWKYPEVMPWDKPWRWI